MYCAFNIKFNITNRFWENVKKYDNNFFKAYLHPELTNDDSQRGLKPFFVFISLENSDFTHGFWENFKKYDYCFNAKLHPGLT